jgi:hypothetical protein
VIDNLDRDDAVGYGQYAEAFRAAAAAEIAATSDGSLSSWLTLIAAEALAGQDYDAHVDLGRYPRRHELRTIGAAR